MRPVLLLASLLAACASSRERPPDPPMKLRTGTFEEVTVTASGDRKPREEGFVLLHAVAVEMRRGTDYYVQVACGGTLWKALNRKSGLALVLNGDPVLARWDSFWSPFGMFKVEPIVLRRIAAAEVVTLRLGADEEFPVLFGDDQRFEWLVFLDETLGGDGPS